MSPNTRRDDVSDDDLSDSAVLLSRSELLEPHKSDKFGLKKGRCHTCLARLSDDNINALSANHCLKEVGVHLDAPRCSLCLEVAKTIHLYRLRTLAAEEARMLFPNLERAISGTKRRKERNEDEILRNIEENLDAELDALSEMLENCRPPGNQDKPEVAKWGFPTPRATDVALARFEEQRETFRTQVTRFQAGYLGSDGGHSER